MAQYMTVPAERLYPFPGEVAPHIAALSEPLAVGVRGVRLGGVTLGQSVAVLGAGSIGLLAIPAAFAAGAVEVFITARHPHQAAMARHLGATRVFPSSDALLHELGDARIDVVIETVGGHANTLHEAATIARAGATIVILGFFDGAPGIPGRETMRKELRFVGSFGYAQGPRRRDFEITTQLIHQHRTALEPLVTHRFTLDQVVQAFETAADKATGSIKVQIEP
jgi:threonine dehydrogenase-like Zn-dependent dehydrogenase